MVEWELAQSLVQTLKNAEKTGAIRLREQIIAYLEERLDDFKHCGKNDCCEEHAYVTQGYITDIKEML